MKLHNITESKLHHSTKEGKEGRKEGGKKGRIAHLLWWGIPFVRLKKRKKSHCFLINKIFP